MAKKRLRNKYISKGLGSSINPSLVHAVRKDRTYLDKMVKLTTSWKLEQNPWITIENPLNETNKPFIKVRANDLWGDPRRVYQMTGGRKEEKESNETNSIPV